MVANSNIAENNKKALEALKGSAYSQSYSSYSGADIKVVVNMYDGGKAAQDYLNSYEKDIEKAATEQYNTSGEIQAILSKLEQVHTGTSEEINLRKKLSYLRKRSNELMTAIPAMQEKATNIRQDTPKMSTKVLAEAQTLSISIFRDKKPVRACGSVYPRGVVRGQRQIAGSIIFTVFNEHVLYEFLEAHPSDFDANTYTSALLDQVPPVDIMVSFANEYGQTSRMTIYGVEFLQEGQTMSIEDLLTENVCQWIARDIDPMRSVVKRHIDANNRLTYAMQPTRASDLLLEDDYQQFKSYISPFERQGRRRSPFL